MSNEWNIVDEKTKADSAEACSGENKGVNKDENKIVSIMNKTNSAEQENMASTTETAAQLVAQYASQPLPQAVGDPILQAVAQAVVQTVAQVQPIAQIAAQAQPIVQAQNQSEPQTVILSPEQPAAESSGVSGVQTAGQSPADSSGAAAVQTGFSTASSAADTPTSSEESTGRALEPDENDSSGGRKCRFFRSDPDDDFDFDEEARPKKRFFRLRSAGEEETRDKLILSRIKDEDLMEYLALEQRRLEFLQQAKEAKEKRILIAFQLLISLAAIVVITYLLQDNPTILISILYIVGIVAALNVWKNPHDRWRKKK